jgi:quercetin dioxygenase-like cupin family protein
MHAVEFFLSNSESVSWRQSPFDGVSQHFLKIGEGAYGVVDVTRIAKGAATPPHRHLVRQRAFFLSGIAETLHGTRIQAGSYCEVPPGERHGNKAIEELLILNVFDGPVTWLLDEGDVYVLREDKSYVNLGRMAPLGTQNLFAD